MQDVIALHAFVPSDDVCCGVAFGMPDVQSCAAWIRKHVEHVIFRLGGIVRSAKRLVVFPELLPFGFDRLMVVGHCDSSMNLRRVYFGVILQQKSHRYKLCIVEIVFCR